MTDHKTEGSVVSSSERKEKAGLLTKIFYRREHKKWVIVPRQIYRSIMISGAIGGTILFVKDAPVFEKSDSDLSNVDIRNEQVLIHIPPLVRNEAAQNKAGGKPSGGGRTLHGSSQSLLHLPGLELVRRKEKFSPGKDALIEATLLTVASDGPLQAEATTGLAVKGEVIIPAGSLLSGSGATQNDRLYLTFVQAVLPDGNELKIEALALDPKDKSPGFSGSVLAKQGLLVLSEVGLQFAGGMAMGLQEKDSSNGVAFNRPSLRNSLLQGAATAGMEQARTLGSKFKDRANRVELSKGTQILIQVLKIEQEATP